MTHHNHYSRSSDEVRRDIERRRAHMDSTVDELEDRLSPGQLLGEVLRLVRGGGSDGASRVAAGAKSFAKDYPIPSALLSAGAVWLAAERARDQDHYAGQGTYARAEGRVGPYRGDEISHDDNDWEHDRDTTDRVKEKASGAAHAMGERASSAKESTMEAAASAKDTVREKASSARERTMDAASATREKAGEMGHRASEAAGTARRKTAEGARRARGGFMHALEENPMAVGAALFGIGVAGGMAAPTSEWEDEHMGDRAQELKDRAKHVAKDAGQSAKRVASDTARAVRDEVQQQGIAEQVKETAKRVASDAKETAKETARERAREEGLTREALVASAKGEKKSATPGAKRRSTSGTPASSGGTTNPPSV